MDLIREEKIEKIEQYDVITFRNIHGKNAGKQSFGPTKDSRTGEFLGIPNYTKKQEEEAEEFFLTKNSNIILEDGKELFIKNEKVDRAYWDMIKWNPEIAFSASEAIANKVSYYIEVKELEHKVDLSRKITVNKAVNLILNDTHKELIFRARLLKLDMSEDTLETIQSTLIDIAETNPDRIIKLYDSNLIGVKLLFYKALDNNIIQKDGAGNYKYGINIIGVDEETSLTFLQHRDSEALLERLKNDVDIAVNERMFTKPVSEGVTSEGLLGEGDYNREVLLELDLVELKKEAVKYGIPKSSVNPMRSKEQVCNAIEKTFK